MISQAQTSSSPSPAEAYDAILVPLMFDPWADELLDRINLRPGEHVLDVACGTGAVTFKARALVEPGGSVVGSDIAPPMLAVARRKAGERGSDITFVEADAEHLPTRSGGYDVVLCQQGIQFFPDTSAAVHAMAGVLRPGGRVGVAVWQPQSRQDLVPQMEASLKRTLGDRVSLNQPFSFGSKERLETEMREAGFRDIGIEEVERVAHHPSAERYVGLMFRPAAAVMPEFASITEQEMAGYVDRINAELAETMKPFRAGAGLDLMMRAWIATARK